jgi:hypothetical protein
MIWSFYQIAFGEYDNLYSKTNYTSYDHIGFALHDEKIQEGLTLFGKYYRGLWS